MKTALLTGVGREGQVGEAVAARLATDGYRLILVDRDIANAEGRAATARSKGGKATALSADLADPDSVDALFGKIRSEAGGKLAALVHLAGGFAATGPVSETVVADWNRQLTINLTTAFLTARSALPMLRQERGSIVFFSSESAIPGAKLSGISAYAVAKSGVLTLATAISQEERGSGVRANILAPAAIRTAANAAAMGPDAKYVEREDVAATVSWLCSNEARAVSGQVIRLSPR